MSDSEPIGPQSWAPWIRLALFCLPVILLIFVPVYLVDPYAVFGSKSIVKPERLENYRTRINSVLFKVRTYTQNPSADIIVGDSQVAQLPEDVLDEASGLRLSNMAYYGASITEMTRTFWLAAASTHLHSVYFGIDFHLFTVTPLENSHDRVTPSLRLLADRSQYFIDHDVLEATWAAARDQFMGIQTDYSPHMSRDAFWQRELLNFDTNARIDPHTVEELRRVVDYCHDHGIMLVFVVPPEHDDVRKRIDQLGLRSVYDEFRDQLRSLGTVWDCSTPNDITTDRAQFNDPFHLTATAAARIAEDMWSDGSKYCSRTRQT